MPPIRTAVAAVALALVAPAPATAGVITFETVPAVGVPTEGLVISTQYFAAHGVTFALENGGLPSLSQVGDPRTAFVGPPGNTQNDRPAANQGVGDFFLVDDGTDPSTAPPSPLLVFYSAPVAAASGVILDIDVFEVWTVEARNAFGTVIGTQTLSFFDANAGDGIATPWGFAFGSDVIASVRLSGTRGGPTPNTGFGHAFDNFSGVPAAAVPEPAGLTLAAVGLLAVARRRS